MSRSKIRTAKEEPLSDMDYDALPEHDESTAEEIHALIMKEKEDLYNHL
jgi:hypothetical protein